MRPWLLDAVWEWSAGRNDRQRSLWSVQSLRRGFLNDRMHDAIVDYLVAPGYLFRQKAHLASPLTGHGLFDVVTPLEANRLFETGRRILLSLDEIVITNEMLKGW